MKAWAPILEMVDINEYLAVLKISDWTGGDGDKPIISGYIGKKGIVDNISEAEKIKSFKSIIEQVLKNNYDKLYR